MPESGKCTLKDQLAREVAHLGEMLPGIRLCAVADGAVDNWKLVRTLSPETETPVSSMRASIRDRFGHAVARDWFERYRSILRKYPEGVEKAVRAIKYPRDAERGGKAEIECEPGYFRKNRHRMRYAELAARGIPIGSGVSRRPTSVVFRINPA